MRLSSRSTHKWGFRISMIFDPAKKQISTWIQQRWIVKQDRTGGCHQQQVDQTTLLFVQHKMIWYFDGWSLVQNGWF